MDRPALPGLCFPGSDPSIYFRVALAAGPGAGAPLSGDGSGGGGAGRTGVRPADLFGLLGSPRPAEAERGGLCSGCEHPLLICHICDIVESGSRELADICFLMYGRCACC